MKLRMNCVQCIAEKKQEKEQDMLLEIREDGVYTISCSNGHESIIILEHHKYEVLFEMGVLALLDGYSREAVSNFAASIERFYEFSVEVLLRNNNILNNDFDLTWKHLRNQSERQLGAYLILYLNYFKRPPIMFDEKLIKFRNNVIHKGKFPTYNEVIKYSEAVFTYIKDHLIELKEHYKEALEIVYDKNVTNYIVGNDVNGKYLVSWSENTVFRAIRPIEEIERLEFAKCLEERKERRTFLNR